MAAGGVNRDPGPRSQYPSLVASHLRARAIARGASQMSIRAPKRSSRSRTSASRLSGRPSPGLS